MSLDTLTKFAELEHERRSLEEKVKEVKSKMHDMKETVAEVMASNGIQNISINGFTVYLKNDRFVKKIDEEALRAALKAEQMGDLIKETINTNSLRSVVLELLDDEERELPASVAKCIEITSQVMPAVRASS